MNKIRNLKLPKPPLYKILLGFTIVYFLVFGILMAHTAGQPDQAPHNYFSKRYSETWGIPKENPNIRYTVTGQPYLYYWINGAVYKIYRALFPEGNLRAVLLWRIISVIYSTLTVFFTYKLAKKVTGNPYAGLLTAFFLSNTLMFVFLSGGISYDNLMNLAGAAALLHLVNIYKGENFIRHTALTGIWVIIGALAKEQFLLMTLIIFLAWLYFVVRNFRKINLSFDKKNIFVGIIFIMFLTLFIGLYGVNLIRYSRTTPGCPQVKPVDVCITYDYRFEYYEPFNLQWIWHVRDDLISPIKYGITYWGFRMVESIWGILAQNTFIPIFSVSLHTILILWSLFWFLHYWESEEKATILLFIILLSYVGYVFLWNYKTEVEFNFQHYGVTGRYLLPVLGAFLTLMTCSFLKIRSPLVKRITLALAIVLYFTGGLGMFISRYAVIFSHWRIHY